MSRKEERRHYDEEGKYQGKTKVEIEEDKSPGYSASSHGDGITNLIILICTVLGLLGGISDSVSMAKHESSIGVIILGSTFFSILGAFLGFIFGVLITRYWWLMVILALIGLALS